MGQEVMSSYLRSKLSSILEEAEGDSGSPSHIISRFRSIQRQIESTDASLIPVDLLYDLIDALSDCRVFAYHRRTPQVSKKGFNLNKLYHLLSELMFRRRIRKRLDTIDKNLRAPSSGDSRPPAKLDIPLTRPIPDTSLIIGLDAEAETIEAWLMATASSEEEGGNALRAIGIEGRCGCGKTALAQKVFASPKVVQEFSPRIWVCLSNMLFDNDPRVGIVKFILGEIVNEDEIDLELELEELVEMLEQRLMGKRNLIVLDDAWRLPGDPHFLSQGLPKGSGGAVIVTGRRKDVISQMVGDEHVIRLEPDLSGEICWQILSTDIQQQGKMEDIHPKLSTIEDDVKRNFDGLPLLAKSFATMLPDLLKTKFEFQTLHMAEAAVTFLLEQLKEVVKEHKDLVSGAENELKQLNNDLGLLKAFLKDAAKATKHEHLFKEMEKQIKEVVYEVEDTIDTCLTKAIATKAAKPKKSFCKLRVGSTSLYLAKEIKTIRQQQVLPMYYDAKIKFSTMQIGGGSGSVDDPRTILKRDKPIRKNRIVGFEDEEATITGYLLQETDGLDVIPIIGIPGQGKTTLAWKIYQNESIGLHFPIRIWVYISQKFSSRDLFLQILRKFTPSKDTSSLSDDELVHTVTVCLEKEKFLLVLDDVWSVDAWNEIKEVLPVSNGKAKILITSRDMDVGMHSSVHRRSHKLRFLTKEESWMLLQYEVFGNLEDCHQELKGIGEQIAIKCDGVPLTIVVIGGILVDQLARGVATGGWEMVSKNVSEALQNDKAQRTTNVVALSFDRLPDDLRDCFVYLGVFPEDYEIPAKMVYGLWIAEGFIHPKERRSLEETAEENLNDLIRRNLVKVDKTNFMGKVKTCRIHDMIRAFCITKSKNENLFQEIKGSEAGVLELSSSEVEKIHRLCFHSDLSNFLSRNPKGPHVRSVLCFYEQPVELKPESISLIPDGFPKLRILESKSIKFHQFPSKVTKLIHLRYLTLFIDDLKILPEAIYQLWNLQTLVVETKSRSITMKANMWRMMRLRHLKTKAAIVLDSKLWEGEAGQSLQTLERLSPESCTEAVSKRATNLKTLGISGKLANIFRTKFLENLHHLEKLNLVNSLTYEPTSEDLLHSLPQPNCFPPNLKRLTLRNTFLSWQNMSTLAMIKSLEVLKLKDNAFVGVSWRVSGYDFPSLQLLLILNADVLLWEASANTFPSLRYLVVKNCENLKEIPESVGTHLHKLEIERLRDSAVESARKIGETKNGEPKGKFAIPFDLKIGPVCDTK